MTFEAWLTLFTVIVTIVILVRDIVPPAVAVLGANVLLLILGITTTGEALSGFANPAPITVAALFIVARGVEKTGALQPLIRGSLGNGKSVRGGLGRLLLPTAAASAVLNNTPIVAMLAPQVADWAEKRDRSPSWYLIPLSFATILGGTITVIGTSTNLVVSGLLEAHGMAPIGMFEISLIGIPVTLLGIGILVLAAPNLLPDRRRARRHLQEEIREFAYQAIVEEGGSLDGVSVEEGGLRHLQGVFLVEIDRRGETIAPATPTTLLRGNDRLTFAGRLDMIRDLQTMPGLASTEEKHTTAFNGTEHAFFEAAVSGASGLVGRTLKESDFRQRYQAAVLAIHRAGVRVNEKLGSVKLKEGDTLLLISDRGFADRWRDHRDFLLVSRSGGTPPAHPRQAVVAMVVTIGMVAIAGLGIMPILHAALIGALLMVLTGVIGAAEARSAVDMDVIILIAAAFGIGAAIESSGLAGLIGLGMVTGVSNLGPFAVLLAVTLATVALTELITNNAAAVLIFPIAIASAQAVGADPRPFAIAVAVAASASFLTPIGYQTNTMVYGLGGYRFGDYARLGLPLTLLVILTILLVVPRVWPF
ncbi:MAG: SLC13 family permease [Gemmatimonas sp.]|nr:SLC13 family permease [Gemmatimonas sp.]